MHPGQIDCGGVTVKNYAVVAYSTQSKVVKASPGFSVVEFSLPDIFVKTLISLVVPFFSLISHGLEQFQSEKATTTSNMTMGDGAIFFIKVVDFNPSFLKVI